FRNLIRLQPRDSSAHLQLGLLLRAAGDHWGAITEFQSALALGRVDLRARYELASTLVQLQHFDEALAEFRAVLEVDPGYALGHDGLGVVCELTDERAKGLSGSGG